MNTSILHHPARQGRMFWTWLRGVAVLPLVCLVACRPAEGPAAQETLEETHARGSSAVSMRGYNYTEEGVQEFYVNGARVSNLPPHGGGGADACCAMLPNVWKEGMTVNLDWTIGHYTVPWTQRKDLSVEEERRCCWSERTLQQTVSIRRYDKPSTLQVFFLLGDKLEVWVSPYDLGHPDHPSGRKYPVDTGAPPKYLERRIRQEKQP